MRSSSVSLSSSISCPDDLKESLCKETIRAVNAICLHLKADNPGLVVQILSMDDLHSALGILRSPVNQGADATASSIAFRNLLIAGALSVAPVSQSPPMLFITSQKEKQITLFI